MVKEYRTIFDMGTDEIVEKKSRFIGYVAHVESEEEADAFVLSIKKKHYDARHNCYAYVIGESQQKLRFSDDGEPGGTAGKPSLEVITGLGLVDVCIVVTRYFGGTLLGTGGLLRAYTQAAQKCVEATEIINKQLVIPVNIVTNYNDLGKIQYLLGTEKIPVTESDYGEEVKLTVAVPYDDYDRLEKQLIEITAAKVTLEKNEAVFAVVKHAY